MGAGGCSLAVADAAEVGEVALMIPTTTLPAGPGEPGHGVSVRLPPLQDFRLQWRLVLPPPPASLSLIPALESAVCFLHRGPLETTKPLFFFP